MRKTTTRNWILALAGCVWLGGAQANATQALPQAQGPPPMVGPIDSSNAPNKTSPNKTSKAEAAQLVEPFEESLAQGLESMRKVAQEQNLAEAEKFSKRLLVPIAGDYARLSLDKRLARFGPRGLNASQALVGFVGLDTRGSQGHGVVHYDLGLLQAEEGATDAAKVSFETAVTLAPGAVRERSTYNLGVLELQSAEAYFQQIPEVHGRTRSAMSPGFMPSQAKGDEEEPDYLVLSRTAYKNALERFVERLKLDWKDADTRANVEWVQRRLDELREIEEKRKSDEGQGMAQDDPAAGEGDEEEGKQDQAGDKGAESEQPEEQPQDPQENKEGQEEEGGEDQERKDREEQEKSEEEQERDKESESDKPSEEEMKEHILTEEEIKRLMKRLEQHDKEGARLRDLVRPRQPKRAKKDW